MNTTRLSAARAIERAKDGARAFSVDASALTVTVTGKADAVRFQLSHPDGMPELDEVQFTEHMRHKTLTQTDAPEAPAAGKTATKEKS